MVLNPVTNALSNHFVSLFAVPTAHHPPTHNRLRAIMAHINFLSIEGQARLAREAGVSPSVVSRAARGVSTPSFAVVLALTRALEKRLGKRIDPRDILNFDGDYPTASVCDLCGCTGCLPDSFYTKDDEIKPEYRGVSSSDWSKQYGSHTAGQEGI